MNATFFLLGAACLGADPAPAPVAAPAPVMVSAAGCGGCDAAPSCDTGCGAKMGFFSKLKARLHCHKSSCGAPAHSCAAPCAPAPVACAPAPVACAPAPCAAACAPACKPKCSLFSGCKSDSCKPSLFDRLKSKFHRSSSSCSACGSSCESGCSTGPAMVAPTPVAPPKDMPIPPKEDPKKTTLAPISPLEFAGTAGKY